MNKRKQRVLLISGIVHFIILQTLEVACGIAADKGVKVHGYDLNGVSGILVSVTSLLFIVLTCIVGREGLIASYVMCLLAILLMLRAVIFMKDNTALAGITNIIICCLSLSIINYQLKKREKESVSDLLTGNGNRRGMLRELRDRTEKKDPFYLLQLDVDDFKVINDNRGHKFGDAVLICVSERIREILGESAKIFRPGGDEFVIFLPDTDYLGEIMEKMIDSIRRPMMIEVGGEKSKCLITVSIGAVHYPDDADQGEQLLKYADIAMYQAKRTGKNQSYLFDSAMEKELLQKAKLQERIKTNLENGGFYMVYQPQYEMGTKKLRGFESLLRFWSQGEDKVSIGELIAVAETSDQILKIDEFVLRSVMEQFAGTLNHLKEPITVSVNVSAKNICRLGFAEMVIDTLKQTGFPAHCLEIEITEYCLAKALDIAMINISKLKEYGVCLALDDFGTGYASLSYLSKLSIDLLKIDKSFVDAIGEGVKNDGFITAVIQIGHLNECKVISEGVETQEQMSFLEREGCDYVQGYFWGKPVPFDEAQRVALGFAK